MIANVFRFDFDLLISKSYQQSGVKWGDMVESGGKIIIFTHSKAEINKMTIFIGDYPCRVDVKSRIILPSAFKKQMPSASQDRFVVKKDVFEKCLILYPMDEWERQVKILRSKINPYNREHSKFLREFYKNTAEVVLDNSNRLLVPKDLLDLVGIDKDIVLAGQDGKIEMWAKHLYDNIGGNEDDFAAMAEKILGGSLNGIDE